MPREPKSLHETALGMLARREHGVEELWRKLVAKEFPAAAARQEVQTLVARGFVNDARYTLARARYRATLSRWGAIRIRQELQQNGVDPDTIARAMQELQAEGVVFVEEAEKAARRRFRQPLGAAADSAENEQTRDEARARMISEALMEPALRSLMRAQRQQEQDGGKTRAGKAGKPVMSAAQQQRMALQKEKQKRIAYLVRRGYSLDEAMRAVDAAAEAALAESS